jgi:hypothetical protein
MKLAALILVSASLLAHSRMGAFAQDSADGAQNAIQSYNESGKTSVDGRAVSYLIRRLPVDSFPDLPETIAKVLRERSCLIPQTFQAHHPENVIEGSFERPGSSDWAVLCSVQGKVELLVFFASSQGRPVMLASAPELAKIQRYDTTGVFGFGWGIDPASPQQVREAQAGKQRHAPLLDHDALMDTVLNQQTIYRFYAHNAWTVVDTSQ